jgi:hypothetical protein
MSKHLLPGFGVFLFLGSSSTEAQTLRIDHQPVGCAAAERFPRLEARFAPAASVAAARVVFQGQTADWYSVAMKAEGAVFAGVLPKPKKSLKSFRYYIEVTDKALGTNRTAEHTTAIVEGAGACPGKVMAGALGAASVVLQGPAGVAALPAGFASTGVVAGSAAGSGSAAGAAGAGASAAGGGGLSTTTLAIVGGAVGAGALAVTRASGSQGFAGAFSFDLGYSFGNCSRVHRNSGTLEIELKGNGGTAAINNARDEVVSVVNAPCGPAVGTSLSWGMPDASVSQSGDSLSFSQTFTGPSVDGTARVTSSWTFAGSVRGDVITGTFTMQTQADFNNGPRVTTNVGSSTVTLTRR